MAVMPCAFLLFSSDFFLLATYVYDHDMPNLLMSILKPTNWLVVALLPVVAPLTILLTAGLSVLAIITSMLTSSVVIFRLLVLAGEFGVSLTASYVGWVVSASVHFLAGRFWGWNGVERDHSEMLAIKKKKAAEKKGSDSEDEKILEALQTRPSVKYFGNTERLLKPFTTSNQAKPAVKPPTLRRPHSPTFIELPSARATPQHNKRAGNKIRRTTKSAPESPLDDSFPGLPQYLFPSNKLKHDLKKLSFTPITAEENYY